jgi:hypothetical protein
MAKKPKEAGRPGQPRGAEFLAVSADKIDRLARPANAPDRAEGRGAGIQPFGAGARGRSEIDAAVHPPGGRRLLEGAHRGVQPLVVSMLLRG